MGLEKREFFVGIDLGWKKKRTSGICILEKVNQKILPAKIWCEKCEDVFGREVFRKISPFLKETKVIAIDAPLTAGQGKGAFRLYEKFLSTKIFRKEKVTPLPPALMPELCQFAKELKEKFEKKGFVLNINLIEVFPTLIKNLLESSRLPKVMRKAPPCKTENQKSALVCAQMAFFHSQCQTRYLGYKDGFLFLPEISFWKKSWREKFSQAWKEKPYLKYKHLITNIFSDD